MKLNLASLFCLISIVMFSQSPKRMVKKLGNDPVFFIDSVSVDKSELQKYVPNVIASVTVFKDKEAINLIGNEGKDGLVYIETKKFAKKRYWNFFKSKSTEYLKIVPSPESDNNIQYIINKSILDKDFEGTLSAIDDKVFKKITILSKEQLEKDFKITNKDFGVLIISDTPDNLYKGNQKF